MSAKIKAFLISIFMFVFSANAYVVNYTPFNPDYIDFDISNTDEYLFENDIVIADDVVLAPGRIKINGSVIIENNGTIQSSIEICDGCQVIIKNRGQINADFIVGTNVSIYQVISGPDEINLIDFNKDYTMFVESNSELSLADVVDSASGANKIIFKNVKLKIDKLPTNKYTNIEFAENVVFVIDGNAYFESEVVLDNVLTDSSVRFESDGDDKMYASVGYIKNGKLYVKQTRNSEYADIIKDKDVNTVIENLPKDDSLLDELNSAIDENQINKILSKSVRFNPGVLRTSLEILNELDMTDFYRSSDNSFSVHPFTIISDDFSLYGINVFTDGYVTNDLNLSLGISLSKMDYQSDYDEFSGITYGIKFGATYSITDDLFARFKTGVSVADFDIDAVLYDGKSIKNPSAEFGYVLLDFGYDFVRDDSLRITPFVGANFTFYDIETDSIGKYNGRVGAMFEYKYNMSGLIYMYNADLFVNTNGAIAADAKIGFVSATDYIGGNIGATIMHYSDALSYKLSIGVNLLF